MKDIVQHFGSSVAFSLIAILGGYAIGGIGAAATVGFLIVLETSLSFDNAVVNAGILRNWDEKWRRRFLVWGILVAVFGMRLVFPVLIVALAAGLGPWAAVDLAVNRPDDYARLLTGAHHQIAAFGGTFLMMVFLKFFVAHNKTHHWLEWIERPMARLGSLEAVEAALTLSLLVIAGHLLDEPERGEFITAGIWGVVTFIIAKGASTLIGGDDAAEGVIKQGAGGFLYLELLDASFSFDGVVGAFAMTHNLLIIALGLGAGALFVRSFTIFLVHRGTLESYRYLEHGAFWAIGALAVIMLLGVKWHIPEAVTGLLGALLIIMSIASSIRANRRSASLS